MFTLTPTAAQQIHKAAQDSGATDLALRIAARQAPDGSIDYGMGFDDSGEDDMRLLIEGVSVLIADHHKDLLDETVLDFVELNPGEFNFIFIDNRPSSAGGCAPTGCGSGGCSSGGCGSRGGPH